MQQTFDYCVYLLEQLAILLGTNYVAVNVWLFCILLPLYLVATIGLIAYLIHKLSVKNDLISLYEEFTKASQ